jgi:hypothetical protein
MNILNNASQKGGSRKPAESLQGLPPKKKIKQKHFYYYNTNLGHVVRGWLNYNILKL